MWRKAAPLIFPHYSFENPDSSIIWHNMNPVVRVSNHSEYTMNQWMASSICFTYIYIESYHLYCYCLIGFLFKSPYTIMIRTIGIINLLYPPSVYRLFNLTINKSSFSRLSLFLFFLFIKKCQKECYNYIILP